MALNSLHLSKRLFLIRKNETSQLHFFWPQAILIRANDLVPLVKSYDIFSIY